MKSSEKEHKGRSFSRILSFLSRSPSPSNNGGEAELPPPPTSEENPFHEIIVAKKSETWRETSPKTPSNSNGADGNAERPEEERMAHKPEPTIEHSQRTPELKAPQAIPSTASSFHDALEEETAEGGASTKAEGPLEPIESSPPGSSDFISHNSPLWGPPASPPPIIMEKPAKVDTVDEPQSSPPTSESLLAAPSPLWDEKASPKVEASTLKKESPITTSKEEVISSPPGSEPLISSPSPFWKAPEDIVVGEATKAESIPENFPKENPATPSMLEEKQTPETINKEETLTTIAKQATPVVSKPIAEPPSSPEALPQDVPTPISSQKSPSVSKEPTLSMAEEEVVEETKISPKSPTEAVDIAAVSLISSIDANINPIEARISPTSIKEESSSEAGKEVKAGSSDTKSPSRSSLEVLPSTVIPADEEKDFTTIVKESPNELVGTTRDADIESVGEQAEGKDQIVERKSESPDKSANPETLTQSPVMEERKLESMEEKQAILWNDYPAASPPSKSTPSPIRMAPAVDYSGKADVDIEAQKPPEVRKDQSQSMSTAFKIILGLLMFALLVVLISLLLYSFL